MTTSDQTTTIRPLPKNMIKNKLMQLFWDQRVDRDQLYRLLQGKIPQVGHIRREDLFLRILMTMDWYTILRIIPAEQMQVMLSDAVLEKIRFMDLREKYRYARQELLR